MPLLTRSRIGLRKSPLSKSSGSYPSRGYRSAGKSSATTRILLLSSLDWNLEADKLNDEKKSNQIHSLSWIRVKVNEILDRA